MSMVKVVLDRLGGVSSIKWTECGPRRLLRSKDWPSIRRCEQSKVTAEARTGSKSNADGRAKPERCGRMAARMWGCFGGGCGVELVGRRMRDKRAVRVCERYSRNVQYSSGSSSNSSNSKPSTMMFVDTGGGE